MYKLAGSSKFNLIQISATAKVEPNASECWWDVLSSLTPLHPRQEALEEFFSFSSLTSQWLENPEHAIVSNRKRTKARTQQCHSVLSRTLRVASVS